MGAVSIKRFSLGRYPMRDGYDGRAAVLLGGKCRWPRGQRTSNAYPRLHRDGHQNHFESMMADLLGTLTQSHSQDEPLVRLAEPATWTPCVPW